MITSPTNMIPSPPTRMITLRTSDKKIFEVTEEIAEQSEMIKNMINDKCADSVIPLLNISSQVLDKIIKYLHRHAEPSKTTSSSVDRNAASSFTLVNTSTNNDVDLKTFDEQFIKVDQNMLFELTLAANFLHIKNLLELTTQTIADTIKNMSVEEVRNYFNIENDFTPQEEADIRRENAWAFE